MKTLHISIILTLLLSITIINTILPAVQGISGSAYFMKSNSTAKIYADFTIPVLNNQSWDLKPEIVTSLDDFNTKPAGMIIDANPNSFTGNQHHVHVAYTITAKDNTKGVYPLFLFFCGTSPLVVGLNESEVNPAIYNKFFTAAYTCPAISGGIPDMNIVGYSGIISKTLSIDSNNTVTVIHVNTLGPPLQTPIKQFKTGTLAKDVRCRIYLQLIIKAEDGSPACVRSESVQKLIQLGWAMKDKKSYHVYYPGLPPPIVDTRIAKVVSGTQEAQSIVGYYVGLPHYLPPGYSMQTILVDGSSKFVKILASNFPLTQNTTSVEFMEKGGIMIYMEPTTSEFNQTSWIAGWIKQTNDSSEIKINEYNGVINDITKGKRFDEEIDLPAEIVVFPDNAIVEISAFLHPDELTKIAEGMLTK